MKRFRAGLKKVITCGVMIAPQGSSISTFDFVTMCIPSCSVQASFLPFQSQHALEHFECFLFSADLRAFVDGHAVDQMVFSLQCPGMANV